MILEILKYCIKFIPFLLIMLYTLGFGISLHKKKKPGLSAAIVLILGNIAVFIFLLFIKQQ
jgi:hypothetical protein